jgi:hypothetical protein
MQNITFPFTVTLAGDSIWDYEGPSTVTVTNIEVSRYSAEDIADWADFAEVGDIQHISVEHDANWRIYTDSGFEAAISRVLGVDVAFTEQGMQEDGVASLEQV